MSESLPNSYLCAWSTGKKRDLKAEAEGLLKILAVRLGGFILEAVCDKGDAVIKIKRDTLLDVMNVLKLDSELAFNFLVDVTAVDWLDKREHRFEMVYHLMSLAHGHRLRVKLDVPEEDPQVESVMPLWRGANFMEREVWDMFGIKFKGHPDLRRILMYDEFKGHPLRKDYPVQGKQPRVLLRYPEVRNTALDMERPSLVQITKRPRAMQSAGAKIEAPA